MKKNQKSETLEITLQPKHKGTVADDVETARKLIHRQNFKLLRAQKSILNNMLGKKKLTEAEQASIEGMLCLIDAIQDTACDQYGYDPNDIYNFTNERGGRKKVTLRECKEIVLKG